MNLLQAEDNEKCKQWLDAKPQSSVIYLSFGSFASLPQKQMDELANGLIACNKPFIWVVRAAELNKLPCNFVEHSCKQGLVVSWSSQLDVLGHESVGCFVTHCGWNSTIEALSLGVPMVAMPQWTDQTTNAKYVEDVWGVGIRARSTSDDDGGKIVLRGEFERCIREVMEGERSEEIRQNAKMWRNSVEEAMSKGGSSDQNLNEFVEFLNEETENHSLTAEIESSDGSFDESMD